MSEPFLGSLMQVAYTFNQRGFANCDGQLLPIAQNTALFSLLGTMYGGDGETTFGLPDLRGRVVIGAGQGAGLPRYDQGDKGGAETATVTAAEMPAHAHGYRVSTESGEDNDPGGRVPAKGRGFGAYTGATGTDQIAVLPDAGGGQPHTNLMPSLVIRWVICTQGLFPSPN